MVPIFVYVLFYAHEISCRGYDYGRDACINLTNFRVQLPRRAYEASFQGPWQGDAEFRLASPIVSCPPGSTLTGFAKRDARKAACFPFHDSTPCIVYSVGSANRYGFEEQILKRTTCEVHTFDCTVSGKSIHPNHKYHPFCLGSAVQAQNFKHFKTLQQLMDMLGHANLSFLKMDIEGYEFDVVFSWDISSRLPSQIAFELHARSMYALTNSAKEAATRDMHTHLMLSRPRHLQVIDTSMLLMHLANLGFATVSRDDSSRGKSCTELLVQRVCSGSS